MHVEKSDVTATFTHSSPPMDTATPLNIFIGVVAALSSLVAVLVTSRYIDQCLRAWQGFPSQRHVILLSTLIPVNLPLFFFWLLLLKTQNAPGQRRTRFSPGYRCSSQSLRCTLSCSWTCTRSLPSSTSWS